MNQNDAARGFWARHDKAQKAREAAESARKQAEIAALWVATKAAADALDERTVNMNCLRFLEMGAPAHVDLALRALKEAFARAVPSNTEGEGGE